MSSAGVDAATFRPLVGWDHVVQSISRILSTELGSRVERRDFGSIIPRLLDKPQNEESIINFYIATAEALEPRLVRGRWYGEPRFALTRTLLKADVPGQVTIALFGNYLPNGHRGDFRSAAPREITYSANRLSDIIVLKAAG